MDDRSPPQGGDAPGGSGRGHWAGSTHPARSLGIAPHGRVEPRWKRIATGGLDRTVKLWDPAVVRRP